jgi:hypothetical protein
MQLQMNLFVLEATTATKFLSPNMTLSFMPPLAAGALATINASESVW